MPVPSSTVYEHAVVNNGSVLRYAHWHVYIPTPGNREGRLIYCLAAKVHSPWYLFYCVQTQYCQSRWDKSRGKMWSRGISNNGPESNIIGLNVRVWKNIRGEGSRSQAVGDGSQLGEHNTHSHVARLKNNRATQPDQ